MKLLRTIKLQKPISVVLQEKHQLPLCLPKRNSYKRAWLSRLPRDNLIAEFKNKVHENNTPLSNNEWRDLRHILLAKFKSITPQNIDAVILNQLNNSIDLGIAKNYIKFLENEGVQPNYATLGKLLRVYYLACVNEGISEADEKEVLKIYQQIREKHDVFDATTCENLTLGILTTDRWKDSLELLEMTKLTASPSITAYSCVIAKAFTAKEIELGWKLLEEMVIARKQPKCEAYIALIDFISKNPNTFVMNLEKLFEFLGKHEILISQTVVNKLKQQLEANGYSVFETSLNENGKCDICQSYMRNISITDEEFNKLSSSFLERVLIRKDVFQKSTPKELENFVKFVNETGPYDCVIDGLNVAYSCGAKKPPKVYVYLLTAVVKYFQKQNKHVLVLGRKHMNKWPKDGLNFIKRNACLFLTNDLSQDDPFLLYATIQSGQTTDFFSRDLMRQHAFLLGPELKSIFRRWQQEHQYSLLVATDLGKVLVKEPIRHIKYAQEVKSIWHIPYKENYSPNPSELFEVPDSWLCIKLNK